MFNFVIAQSNQSNETSSSSQSGNVIDKAYQCLETQISNKAQAELSLQEAVFGTLALGSKSKLTSVIDGKAISGERWAESSNSIKDTSQGGNQGHLVLRIGHCCDQVDEVLQLLRLVEGAST